MKITRCKYGHYYDKAYFRECPHCCRERGGRDEDIIIEGTDSSADLMNRNGIEDQLLQLQNNSDYEGQRRKEKDRENVKRWIGEAWDELEEILSEDNGNGKEEEALAERESCINSVEKENRRSLDMQNEISEQKIEKDNKKAEVSNRIKIEEERTQKEENIYNEKKVRKARYQNVGGSQNAFMLFAAMPLKVIKNQEFCMDFCILPEKDWETGAKMLSFKSQESIRDLKPVQMILPAKAVLRILYKEEEIFHKEMKLDAEKEKVFYTFPVTVTDTRDRRFHMIKAVFEVEEQNIEIPLYLMPNP